MMNDKIIGVDLGGTNIRSGRIFNDEMEVLQAGKISSQADEKIILNEVMENIHKVFDNEVTAIGVGVPSVVDPENGTVYDVQNIPSWKKIELGKILEKEFGVPVKVNNDANCFVLGEKYFGFGKSYKNIVGLTMGTGLGAGLILNDKLYMGANIGAGEFGMIPYKEHNLEYYCSGRFFVSEYDLTGEEVYNLAKQNDEKGIEILNEFGRNLGMAIQIIMFAVDPEIIILGGSVSKSYDIFINEIIKTLNKFPYVNSIAKLKIIKSDIENISVYGAASLHYQDLNNLILK